MDSILIILKKIKHQLFLIKERLKVIKSKSLNPSKMVGRIFDLKQKKLVNLPQFNLYVMPNDYIGNHIIQSRSYEPHVTKIIKNILRENHVFLDIGANVGYFTMLASTITKNKGKVIAFEPNPQNLQLIYSSIQTNQFNNIDIYPFAASDKKTILRFLNVGSNACVVGHNASYQKNECFVQSVILDDILKDEPQIDLIKIDIEGHEPFAIKGMTNIIKKYRPNILAEFHPWAMKFYNTGDPIQHLHTFINLGYKISIINPDGELKLTSTPDEVLTYWKSLNKETIHLDLFAEPVT